ncbi:MAG: hypothetical protein LQ340_005379, partial [Diploschistes diacapsis]
MPWRPLPRIAFAIAIYPFEPSSPADLPLELGDELYIIEEGGKDYSWCRGYLVAPPSILAGLTSIKGQTLEARVFSGIFPRACVEIRELMEHTSAQEGETNGVNGHRVKRKDESHEDDEQDVTEEGESADDADAESSAESSLEDGMIEKVTRKLKPAKRKTTGMTAEGPGASGSETQRKPAPPVPLLKIGDETPSLASEPLVDEIASCLREWQSTKLHELLLSRRYTDLANLGKLVQRVDLGRRQLLHGVLTNQESDLLREKTVWHLVNGNKVVGEEIIIRDPKQRGRLLTGSDNAIEVAKLQASMSLLDKPPSHGPDRINLHHLLLELRGISGQSQDMVTLVMYICSKKREEPARLLSEPFSLGVSPRETIPKGLQSRVRTLFADLSSLDIGETSGSGLQVYLVVKVQVRTAIKETLVAPSPTSPVNDHLQRPESSQDHGRAQSVRGRRSLMWGQNRQGGSQRQRPHAAGALEERGSSVQQPSEHRGQSLGLQEVNDLQKPQVERDAGIAFLNLNKKFFEESSEGEEVLMVWAPTASEQEPFEPGDQVDFLNEHYPSTSGRYGRSKPVERITIRLYSFIDPDADHLIRTKPTLLQHVTKTPKIGFSGAPTKSRSDIYLTLVKPSFPGQALFSHPEKGAIPIPNVSEMHNFQLTLEVRKSSGERIDHCIHPSSDSDSQTAWRTTAICRGESWQQTIRLAIPSEDVPDCHIVMSLADFPDFPFALCWMPLWKEGAFLQDGPHTLLLHEYSKMTTQVVEGRGAYLDLVWDSKSKDAINRESWSAHMSCLRIDSFLCSTTFSQDQVLLGLLRWEEHSDDQLLLLLRQMVFVPEIEIVKLVSDTLDALFSILIDRSGNDEFEDLVFNALVTVLSIVHDRRFHLDPLVNEYAELRFNYPFATPCLIRSYLRLIARRTDYQNSRQLRATLKVGRQIIKFIIVARKQQKAKEAGIGITSNEAAFMRDFKGIFEALEDQMRDESPSLIGSKTLIVQHIHTWLPELLTCFSQEDILNIGISFVDACANVTGKLILHKLVLIWNFARLSLSVEPELRAKLMRKVGNWLDPYWGAIEEPNDQYREQVRLCCSIVALRDGDYGDQTALYYVKVLESYHRIRSQGTPTTCHFSLLFPSTYPFPSRPTNCPRNYDEALIEIAALKATFKSDQLMAHYKNIPYEMATISRMALDMNMSVLRGEAFPKTWLTLYLYHHRIIFDLLDFGSQLMIRDDLPPPEDADKFDTEMWKSLLLALLELVRSETLALEILPEQKRRAVWKIVGDIRQHGAELLGSIWDTIGWETDPEERRQYGLEKLGGYQVQYVPSLVGPILELCLSVHEGLRGCSVEILQSMIISEWSLNEDLAVIEGAMIYALDELFKTKNIGESAHNRFFIDQLLGLFEPFSKTPDNGLWQATKELLDAIDQLLDLLIAVHAPEQQESLRIMNTLKLMDFLKGLEKEDIFIGYVHQLVTVEVEASNFREAGLALGLHADLYSWDLSRTVRELKNPPFPKQSSFERKESLYFEMIKHFEEAGAWGCALDCYRELADQYEHTSFDFAKLARTQRSTARIYEFIARGAGETSRYFRVAFRGLGFPATLRGKEFVYEGKGSERLLNFTDRLQQQHPAAQVSSKADVDNTEGQHLHVTAVSPHRELDHPAYQQPRVPLSTKEFLLSSKPNKFAITSRRHSPRTGIQEQWVEKTVYHTADSFPTILRRSEIITEETVELSPLETAIERTVRKTFELAILQRRLQDADKASVHTMIEAIKSSVDATSSTSVSQYRNILQNHTASTEEDEATQPLVAALQTALLDFVSILKRCLTDLSHTGHRIEHKNFSILFQSTFAPELATLNLTAPPTAAVAPAPDPELVLPPSNLDLSGEL